MKMAQHGLVYQTHIWTSIKFTNCLFRLSYQAAILFFKLSRSYNAASASALTSAPQFRLFCLKIVITFGRLEKESQSDKMMSQQNFFLFHF